MEVGEFLGLGFHFRGCRAADGGVGLGEGQFGEEEPLGETVFADEEEGGVVHVNGYVGVAGGERGDGSSDAEETVVGGGYACDF